jgi:hypothetical protein
MINVKLRVPSYKYKIKVFSAATSNTVEVIVNKWLDVNDIIIHEITHSPQTAGGHTITILYKDIQKE